MRMFVKEFVNDHSFAINFFIIAICLWYASGASNTDASQIFEKSQDTQEISELDFDDLLSFHEQNSQSDAISIVTGDDPKIEPDNQIDFINFNEHSSCPDSNLPGVLIATFESSDPSKSFALIETPQNMAAPFGAGQSYPAPINNKATILAVIQDKVLLKRADGTFECLKRHKAATEDMFAPKLHVAANAEPITLVDSRRRIIDKNLFESSAGSISRLRGKARIKPYFKDGLISGFIIYYLKQGSLLSQFGFEKGDIINRVNHMEMASLNDLHQIFSLINNEQDIDIDITRNGENLRLSYLIK